MKLAEVFATFDPLLHGHLDAEEAGRRLFPGAEASPDARRLAIYARFARSARHGVLEGVYAWLHDAVVAAAGAEAWDALVDAYFRAHPMSHPELNTNGAELPAFLRAHPEGLPPFAAELADFEWWEWLTRAAPDDPADAAPGPLRLASTVEVRPYAWDFPAWIAGRRAGAPPERPLYVLFWRAPSLEARREEASLDELRVLKAVVEGAPVSATAILADLRAAGIVLGEP